MDRGVVAGRSYPSDHPAGRWVLDTGVARHGLSGMRQMDVLWGPVILMHQLCLLPAARLQCGSCVDWNREKMMDRLRSLHRRRRSSRSSHSSGPSGGQWRLGHRRKRTTWLTPDQHHSLCIHLDALAFSCILREDAQRGEGRDMGGETYSPLRLPASVHRGGDAFLPRRSGSLTW